MKKEQREKFLNYVVKQIKYVAEQAEKETNFSHRGFYKPRKPMEK